MIRKKWLPMALLISAWDDPLPLVIATDLLSAVLASTTAQFGGR